jgi:preprotein translocase subunit Sss1
MEMKTKKEKKKEMRPNLKRKMLGILFVGFLGVLLVLRKT